MEFDNWGTQGRQYFIQGSQNMNLTLAGVDRDGKDAANDLTFLFLEALKGLAAIPQIVEQLKSIGKKLDEKQALERLADKRRAVDDLIAAAQQLPESATDGSDRSDGET